MSIRRSSLPEISAHTIATWPRVRHDISAGGVAYRRVIVQGDASTTHSQDEELIEVALIATRGGRRWQLPKGSREADESPLQTAIREVHEEVGLHTTNEGFLKQIDYWYWDTYRKEIAELVHKRVDFYLLRVVGGILSDASYEVDAVGWFTLDHALRVLTFAGEREVLQLAKAILTSEAEACTIYLIRHAESAVNAHAEQAGQYDELGSSLTDLGRAQAATLANTLQAIDFAAVYTSDKRRAAETATILADDRPVVTTYSLREGPLRDPVSQELESAEEVGDRMVAILQEVALAYAGRTIFMVSHGFAMRALLVRLGWGSFENLPGGSVTNTGYFILRVTGGQVTVLETAGVHKAQP